MFNKSTDMSWLGAEALPGGLAEINRVNQAWLDAAARHERYVRELRQSRSPLYSPMGTDLPERPTKLLRISE